MEFKELTVELEKFKDSEDYNNYIGGFITPDRVGKYLESEDGKKFIQPTLDGYFNKGLSTFKEKTMPSLIDTEIKKRFPDKSESEIELEKLKADIANMQKEKMHESLMNKALLIADSKKLPKDVLQYFIAEDEEKTIENLTKLESVFSTHVESLVDERLKGGYTPPKGDNKQIDIDKMDMNQYAEYWNNQNKQK